VVTARRAEFGHHHHHRDVTEPDTSTTPWMIGSTDTTERPPRHRHHHQKIQDQQPIDSDTRSRRHYTLGCGSHPAITEDSAINIVGVYIQPNNKSATTNTFRVLTLDLIRNNMSTPILLGGVFNTIKS
jgi:hypothetical protein